MSASKDTFDRLKNDIGPGVITGASDDDPSGILTYLQSGVVLGLQALWTTLLTLPLMYGIQETCGRIGLVSGKGIVQLIRERNSKFVLYPIVTLVTAAIVTNIAADLLAMGAVMEILTGWSRLYWMVMLSAVILYCTVIFSYKRLAGALKWLTFSLFFYIVTFFYIHMNWHDVLLNTVMPTFEFTRGNILLLVAIFGTTISPYLFFWQAAEEIEEHTAPTVHSLRFMKRDTFLGMLFSNLTMWFIIAGATSLGRLYGIHEIANFEQAALVLRPLLGRGAFIIFSLGILGTGLLTIPVLAGNVGYAAAEMFGWEEGMNRTFREAKGFYAAIAFATLVGLVFALLGFDPVKLLIYSAVFYTIVTPPVIWIILRLANDPAVMKKHVNGPLANILGWLTFILMTTGALAYFATLVF